MVTKTKKPPIKRTGYVIASRQIIEYDRTGRRLHKVRYGKWKLWNTRLTMTENFRDAAIAIYNGMQRNHVGGIVYRVLVAGGKPTKYATRLYNAKWGHDNEPYARFYEGLGRRYGTMAKLPRHLFEK